ncbi:hypothetical protein [Adhaeretor mobilis]|nr:hypothetical protein [Adhaeretor mobilis]
MHFVPNSVAKFCTSRLWWVLLLVLALPGCGGEEVPRLVDYFDDLEFDAPTDATVEVAVGRYRVPVSVPDRSKPEPEWRQLKFALYVVTAETKKKSLAEAFEGRRGPFQDSVLKIVRNVTADELEDPRLASVKMRLTDMARMQLGEHRVQQLVIVELLDESI